MKLFGLTLFLAVMTMAASLSSCSPLHRSRNAIVVDDYGSMRHIKGKPDRVSKKWKGSAYKPKKNKMAKRNYSNW
ncbi:hypothetical protein [Pontibacter roseus]|uniref:hypothetical protein n=1 Tax=Pontibacter roseus TaxID=336989 RepID=UPI000364B276|nr:hypothetical protein [Pontibacter roseus]